MALAYHITFGAYGFWLPNDPRGSGSDYVRSLPLLRFGPATKTGTRRSTAQDPHDSDLRMVAKSALTFPPVEFNGQQARSIGQGFGDAVRQGNYTVWACSILPQHVHLIVAAHQNQPARIRAHFKGSATRALIRDGLHPMIDLLPAGAKLPSPWGDRGWTVFLDTRAKVCEAIQYVQENPVEEGKPRQHWSFVSRYG